MIARAVAIGAGLALAACGHGNSSPGPTVPEAIAAPAPTVDQGELLLRSAGEDIGHEVFTMKRDGELLRVDLTAQTTFPDPMYIEIAMWVDPASWRLDRHHLHLSRGGTFCTFHVRNRGDVVEAKVEDNYGDRRLIEEEAREHAEYFVSLRPAITETAICATADDQPRALESFAPWYVVRTAPRKPSELPTADGARKLDLVRVDDLIDVYCDGATLAIVHYPQHAFVAARAEYDTSAQALAAADPTDDRWAGELACPAPPPHE